MNRELNELPMDAEVDKRFYLDYLSFAIPSRYICSLALYEAFAKETEDFKKRTFAVGIAHQRFMAMEDSIQLFIALLALTKKAEKTTFFKEIAIQHGRKEEDDVIDMIRNATYLTNIGLKKDPSSLKVYEQLGLTKTVFNKQWIEFKNGHKKLLLLYNEYKRDYNKIKHGFSLISSTRIFTESESDWNQFVCTVVPDKTNTICKLRILTAIGQTVTGSHLEEIKNAALNNVTLMHMYAIKHFRNDKVFVKKLNKKMDHTMKTLPNNRQK